MTLIAIEELFTLATEANATCLSIYCNSPSTRDR